GQQTRVREVARTGANGADTTRAGDTLSQPIEQPCVGLPGHALLAAGDEHGVRDSVDVAQQAVTREKQTELRLDLQLIAGSGHDYAIGAGSVERRPAEHFPRTGD